MEEEKMTRTQDQLALKQAPEMSIITDIPEQSYVFHFPEGVIGFPELKSFILLPIEKEEYAEFRRLQSLDNTDYAFFLYNLKGKNDLICLEDLEQASADLNMTYEMTEIYGICTLSKTTYNKCEFRINLRAPLVLDRVTNMASQYLFLTKDYDFKHFLGVY